MKRLIVFDLDGTLAESKSSLDAGMAALLNTLLGLVRVAVISGGAWPQFEKQLLANLCKDAQNDAQDDVRLDNLSLLPTCGTKFYQYNSGWELLYSEDFTDEEKHKIILALQQTVSASGFEPKKTWGEPIEDRGSQITFSALGQQAPIEAKKSWDPDFEKRKKMKAALDELLPEFSVHLGGSTSIDVTKPGIDKAYGIRKLRDILDVSIDDMVFIGDAIFPGGNDYPAFEAGVECLSVKNPDETERVISTFIKCLDVSHHTQQSKATE